ncbi:centromere protein X isoform X2 [Papio anubis]|uniref:centromere protein X isoform X2 n=1 Tax=Papio anubis TaxID=9555 RepID=UPI0004F2052C|nr:centromere protein X isoform X2 [Papio anubis]XP_011921464.1 PREDICTED: centromere protein X isoform X4 [Cercocebus atys]
MLCLSPAGLLWVRCCDLPVADAGGLAGCSQELVSRLLHLHFKDDKTKVSGDALQLMAELLKIFVVEAAVRGVRQAQAEDTLRVDVDQLEKLLDF